MFNVSPTGKPGLEYIGNFISINFTTAIHFLIFEVFGMKITGFGQHVWETNLNNGNERSEHILYFIFKRNISIAWLSERMFNDA